jgi:hypothetical protein
LRFIIVDWIEVWMASQDSPSELLFNEVSMGFGVDLNSICRLGLYVTDNVPDRNYEGVITTGADAHGVAAAGYSGPEERPSIVVGAVNVDHRFAGRGGKFFKRPALYRATDEAERYK